MHPRERIETPRLVLVPMKREQCQGLLAGDLSVVEAGEGWPMEDSLVNMRTAEKYDVELPGWFVTLDGRVIGDIFTHGDVRENGDIEVGYNLAAPYRGRGYAPELLAPVANWLLQRQDVGRVVAQGVEADNIPSRRTLERVGFVLEQEDAQLTWYALSK